MYRELMDYPPAANLMTVKLSSKYEKNANDAAARLHDYVKRQLEKDMQYAQEMMPRIIGPTKAPVYKLNDIFSVLLFFKHKQYTVLTQIKDILEKYIKEQEQDFKTISVQFDFNQ